MDKDGLKKAMEAAYPLLDDLMISTLIHAYEKGYLDSRLNEEEDEDHT